MIKLKTDAENYAVHLYQINLGKSETDVYMFLEVKLGEYVLFPDPEL